MRCPTCCVWPSETASRIRCISRFGSSSTRKDCKDTTQTERFSLMDAATLHNLWTGEKTWSVWMKVLQTRKSDEGVPLAFPVREVIFNAAK